MKLRTEDLTWENVEQEIIVLDSRASHYYRLNGSGALLWTILDDGASKAEMISKLMNAYSINDDAAANDVDTFVAELERLELLVDDV